MNEEALNDSYNLFVKQGYTGSIQDYKSLISTNEEALKDSYDLFAKEGYNDNIEDYKTLLLGEKKKRDSIYTMDSEGNTLESPSEDYSSDLSGLTPIESLKHIKLESSKEYGFEITTQKINDLAPKNNTGVRLASDIEIEEQELQKKERFEKALDIPYTDASGYELNGKSVTFDKYVSFWEDYKTKRNKSIKEYEAKHQSLEFDDVLEKGEDFISPEGFEYKDDFQQYKNLKFKELLTRDILPQYSLEKEVEKIENMDESIDSEFSVKVAIKNRMDKAIDLLPDHRSKELAKLNFEISSLRKKLEKDTDNDQLKNALIAARFKYDHLMRNNNWWDLSVDDQNKMFFDENGAPYDKDFLTSKSIARGEDFLRDMRERAMKFKKASGNKEEFQKLWSHKYEEYIALKEIYKDQKVKARPEAEENYASSYGFSIDNKYKENHRADWFEKKYIDAKKDFIAINQIYLTNTDPSSIKKHWYDLLGRGFIGQLSDKHFSRSQVSERFVKVMNQEGFPITKSQENSAKLSILDQSTISLGSTLEIAGEFILTELITAGLGGEVAFARGFNALSKVARTKYGKNADALVKFFEEPIKQYIKFSLVPNKEVTGAMGFGEGLASNLIKDVTLKNKVLNFLAKIAVGGTSETIAEYSGELTNELVKNGFNVEEAIDKVVGKDADEATRKLAVTMILTFGLSTSGKTYTAISANLYKNAKKLPEGTKGKKEIIEALEQANQSSDGKLLKVKQEKNNATKIDLKQNQESTFLAKNTNEIEKETLDFFDADEVGEIDDLVSEQDNEIKQKDTDISINENNNTLKKTIENKEETHKNNKESQSPSSNFTSQKQDFFDAVMPGNKSTNSEEINEQNLGKSDAKIKTEKAVLKGKPIISKNLNYQIKKDVLGNVEVFNRDGTPTNISSTTRSKYIEEYIEQTDFDYGTKAITAETPYTSNEIELVANHSENPKEIAQTIVNNGFETLLDDKTQAIAQNVKNGVQRESFQNAVGYSSQKEGVSQSYFHKNGKPLDQIQMDIISDLGLEYDAKNPAVGIEEITDFMLSNKGSGDFLNQSDPNLVELLGNFKKLTGLSPTKKNIEAVSGISKKSKEQSDNISWDNQGDILFSPKKQYGKHKGITDHVSKSYGSIDKFNSDIEHVNEQIKKNKDLHQYSDTQKDAIKLPKEIKPKTILDSFTESGYINFIGTQINSPQDLADLYEIHRSPRIEKGHVVYIKDGKIVYTRAETLGLPYVTSMGRDGGKDINQIAKILKADKVYLLHNHPSGNPTPSHQDIKITKEIFNNLDTVDLEHIVIDSDKFSIINKDGNVTYDQYKHTPRKLFSKRYSLSRNGFIDQRKVFEVARELSKGGAPHHVIYITSDSKISGYEIIDGFEKKLEAHIYENLIMHGASSFVVVTNGSNKNINKLKRGSVKNRLDFIEIKNGHLTSKADQSKSMLTSTSPTILWESSHTYNKSIFGDESLIAKNKELKILYNKTLNAFDRLKTKTAKAKIIRQDLRKAIRNFIDTENLHQMSKRDFNKILTAIDNAETKSGLDKALDFFEKVMVKTEEKKQIADLKQKVNLKDKKFNDAKQEISNKVKQLGKDFFEHKISKQNLKGIQKSELESIYEKLSSAATKRQVKNLTKQLEGLFYTLESRKTMNEINSVLKRKFSKKESGRRKANLTDEKTTNIINGIKSHLKQYVLSKKGVSRKNKHNFDLDFLNELLDKQKEYLNNLSNLRDREIENLSALNITIGIINSKIISDPKQKLAALQEAQKELTEIYDLGRSNFLEWVLQKKQERNDFIIAAVEANNVNGKSLTSDKQTIIDNRNSLIANFNRLIFNWTSGKNMGDLDSVLQIIDKKGNRNINEGWAATISELIKNAATQKEFNLRQYSKDIKKKQREIFGKLAGKGSDFMMNKILNKEYYFKVKRPELDLQTNSYNFEQKKEINITLTESRLLNLWMHYKNPETHAGFESAGYDADFMNKVDALLNPKSKEYGEFLFEFYDDYYTHINKTYKSMYGHSLGKPKYYAGKLMRSGFSESEVDLMGGVHIAKTSAGGSTKERVQNSLPIIAQDVNVALSKYLFESEHFTQYAPIHSKFDAMINDRRFVNSVMNNDTYIGDALLKQLAYYRDLEMVRGGKETESLRVLDIMMSNVVKSTLAIKPKIALTQMLSIPNVVKFLPRGKNALNGFNPVTYLSDAKFIFKNSKYISNRLDSNTLNKAISGLNSVSTEEVLSSRVGNSVKQFLRMYDAIQNALMINVKIGDLVGVMGSFPVYSSWKAEYISRGFDHDIAQEKAMMKFENAVDRAQQGQTKFSKSKLQNSPIGKLFSMFATSPMQNYRNAVSSYIEVSRYFKKSGQIKGSLARHLVSIVNFSIAQPLLYTWVAGRLSGGLMWLFNDDEPTEEDKAMLSTLILRNASSMPLLGSTLQLIVDELLEKKQSFGSVLSTPILKEADSIKNYLDRAKKSKTQKTKHENYQKALKSLYRLLSGLPIDTISKYKALIENLEKYQDQYDVTELLWLWAGHNKFVIDANTKKKERSSKSKNDQSFH